MASASPIVSNALKRKWREPAHAVCPQCSLDEKDHPSSFGRATPLNSQRTGHCDDCIAADNARINEETRRKFVASVQNVKGCDLTESEILWLSSLESLESMPGGHIFDSASRGMRELWSKAGDPYEDLRCMVCETSVTNATMLFHPCEMEEMHKHKSGFCFDCIVMALEDSAKAERSSIPCPGCMVSSWQKAPVQLQHPFFRYSVTLSMQAKLNTQFKTSE
eukprot:jgi/Mesvir1/18301/Mv18456-RA.1